ncbi:hypothetical protein MTO96_022853 [Rhipicephalus appendiculatus]
MTTSAPVDPVWDAQTGATCHLFADTTGGTLTEPAAISHVCGEATASIAMTADDAQVLPVVELPASLMTRRPRKHVANMPPRSQDIQCRLPKALPQPQTHRPMILHSPSLLRITTCYLTHPGTVPKNLKTISTPHIKFNDTVVLISAAQVRCLFLRQATDMCQRRCHTCTPRARATSPSLFYTPVHYLLCSPSEIAVCVAKPFFRHGVALTIDLRAHARITRR